MATTLVRTQDVYKPIGELLGIDLAHCKKAPCTQEADCEPKECQTIAKLDVKPTDAIIVSGPPMRPEAIHDLYVHLSKLVPQGKVIMVPEQFRLTVLSNQQPDPRTMADLPTSELMQG